MKDSPENCVNSKSDVLTETDSSIGLKRVSQIVEKKTSDIQSESLPAVSKEPVKAPVAAVSRDVKSVCEGVTTMACKNMMTKGGNTIKHDSIGEKVKICSLVSDEIPPTLNHKNMTKETMTVKTGESKLSENQDYEKIKCLPTPNVVSVEQKSSDPSKELMKTPIVIPTTAIITPEKESNGDNKSGERRLSTSTNVARQSSDSSITLAKKPVVIPTTTIVSPDSAKDAGKSSDSKITESKGTARRVIVVKGKDNVPQMKKTSHSCTSSQNVNKNILVCEMIEKKDCVAHVETIVTDSETSGLKDSKLGTSSSDAKKGAPVRKVTIEELSIEGMASKECSEEKSSCDSVRSRKDVALNQPKKQTGQIVKTFNRKVKVIPTEIIKSPPDKASKSSEPLKVTKFEVV